jgi:quercetin dioxygenase-like cupin family protein
MNQATYTFIADILQGAAQVPADSILSKTAFQNDNLKVILFSFAPGQELSEHTAARPAILHFLEGEGELTLGEEKFNVSPGAWAHMPPRLPHSLVASTPLKMMLILL